MTKNSDNIMNRDKNKKTKQLGYDIFAISPTSTKNK